MSSRSQKMEFSPELPTWFIALGTAVITLVSTLGAAVLASRSSSQKSRADHEIGMTNAQREWVSLQIDSMRGEITRYEALIITLQKEHREELARQEKHCQDRLDTLGQQVDYLMRQQQAYSLHLKEAGICINPPLAGQ